MRKTDWLIKQTTLCHKRQGCTGTVLEMLVAKGKKGFKSVLKCASIGFHGNPLLKIKEHHLCIFVCRGGVSFCLCPGPQVFHVLSLLLAQDL